MKTFFTFIILIAVIICGYFLLRDTTPNESPMQTPVTETPAPVGEPMFAWEYESLGEDEMGILRTNIGIAATYPDGTVVRKELREVQGGCNDYPDPDRDTYEGMMIMCYYAGFGEYYKIVKTDLGYDVRRKEFEEASPDYEPPLMEYETIATF